MLIIFICILGGMILGFMISAMLSANKYYDRYSEEFLFNELINFKNYWEETLENEHDQELAKDIIEDFQLGLLKGFRKE